MWQYAEDNAREAEFTVMASGEGVDTSNLAARGQRRRRLRIVRGTAESMPFADGEFDAVVCTLVRSGRAYMHHVGGPGGDVGSRLSLCDSAS